MKSVIRNQINAYSSTNPANAHPIGGSKIPYTVKIIAMIWVVVVAANNSFAGFLSQKCPLVLATYTVKDAATDNFKNMKDWRTAILNLKITKPI